MRKNSGFTLIEMLIVVAISAMLAAIAIGYSGVERDQTALSVEVTEISQFILQARSLAIATYGNAAGSGLRLRGFIRCLKRNLFHLRVRSERRAVGIVPTVSDIASAPGSGRRSEVYR